jgi:hypothetical protein
LVLFVEVLFKKWRGKCFTRKEKNLYMVKFQVE